MSSKFLFFPLLFLTPILYTQNSDWILSSEKDDMKVYFRESSDSKVKELKFTFTVNSTLSAIVSVLDDVENYSKWVYKLDNSKILKKVNENEMFYYNLMDFPWPLSDRDMIGYSRTFQNPNTKIVTSHTLGRASYLDEKEDIVRIKTVEIKYIMKPNNNGSVTIDYYLKSDPAGNLPSWLVNLALEHGPTETIKEFRKLLASEPYKSASVPYITEQ